MKEGHAIKECRIDNKVFGGLLRTMRKQGGYKNTEAFSKALREKANYHVSKETVYRIESGKQEPSISYVCAASITLYGEGLSFRMINIIEASLCEEWQLIEEKTKQARAETFRQAEKAIREMMKREELSTYEDPETGDIYF